MVQNHNQRVNLTVKSYAPVCQENNEVVRNFIKDEGRPLAFAGKEEIAIRPLLLGLIVPVVSERG